MVDSVVVFLSLFFHSNFQSSAMFEGSESADTQEVKSDSTLGSSVSACKKVCVPKPETYTNASTWAQTLPSTWKLFSWRAVHFGPRHHAHQVSSCGWTLARISCSNHSVINMKPYWLAGCSHLSREQRLWLFAISTFYSVGSCTTSQVTLADALSVWERKNRRSKTERGTGRVIEQAAWLAQCLPCLLALLTLSHSAERFISGLVLKESGPCGSRWRIMGRGSYNSVTLY